MYYSFLLGMSDVFPLQVCFKFLSGLDRAVSGGGVAEGEALLEMVECVHSPYCQLLVRYPTMETQLLKQQLHTINMVRGLLELLSML